MTAIEWTDATWNPVVGCSVTSAGCTNCYAMRMAGRVEAMSAKTGAASHYAGVTKKINGNTVWTGKIGIAPDSVWEQPLRRKTPTTYFVNSMGDLFHPNVADAVIDRVFAVMALAAQHRFQILTKYPERMREWFSETYDGAADTRNRVAWQATVDVMNAFAPDWKREGIDGPNRSRAIQAAVKWPLPNVALGVSVENQAQANARIPLLLDTPAAIRFISAEPLLGYVDLEHLEWTHMAGQEADSPCDAKMSAFVGDTVLQPAGQPEALKWSWRSGCSLDWVIVGGESGKGARPMHPDWARSLRDQCFEAGVPFFFKQWGAWAVYIDRDIDDPDWRQNYTESESFQHLNLAGGRGFHGERVCHMQRVGKKAAGRSLDGLVHEGLPLAWTDPENLMTEREVAHGHEK